jgi:hypothetical protein
MQIKQKYQMLQKKESEKKAFTPIHVSPIEGKKDFRQKRA